MVVDKTILPDYYINGHSHVDYVWHSGIMVIGRYNDRYVGTFYLYDAQIIMETLW